MNEQFNEYLKDDGTVSLSSPKGINHTQNSSSVAGGKLTFKDSSKPLMEIRPTEETVNETIQNQTSEATSSVAQSKFQRKKKHQGKLIAAKMDFDQIPKPQPAAVARIKNNQKSTVPNPLLGGRHASSNTNANALSKKQLTQRKKADKRFKRAHKIKSLQIMKDLQMQQQLYQGYANKRIINVNEEGDEENDPEHQEVENEMEFEEARPGKGGSIAQHLGSVDTSHELGNLLNYHQGSMADRSGSHIYDYQEDDDDAYGGFLQTSCCGLIKKKVKNKGTKVTKIGAEDKQSSKSTFNHLAAAEGAQSPTSPLHPDSVDQTSSKFSHGIQNKFIRRLSRFQSGADKIKLNNAEVNKNRAQNNKLVKMLNKGKAEKFQNVALQNKDEWFKYIFNSMENLEDEIGKSEWSAKFLRFLKSNKQNLQVSKIKGEIFFFKFSLEQKQHIENLKLINELHTYNQNLNEESSHLVDDNMFDSFHGSNTDLKAAKSRYSIVEAKGQLVKCSSEIVVQKDNFKDKHIKLLQIAAMQNNTANDPGQVRATRSVHKQGSITQRQSLTGTLIERVEEEYGDEFEDKLARAEQSGHHGSYVHMKAGPRLNGTVVSKSTEQKLNVQGRVPTVRYGLLTNSKDNATEIALDKDLQQDDFTTIDQMKPKVFKLFMFIKNQLQNKKHPLNIIAKKFCDYYVEFYSRELLMDNEKYHQKQTLGFNIVSTSIIKDGPAQTVAEEGNKASVQGIVEAQGNERTSSLSASHISELKMRGPAGQPGTVIAAKDIAVRQMSIATDAGIKKEELAGTQSLPKVIELSEERNGVEQSPPEQTLASQNQTSICKLANSQQEQNESAITNHQVPLSYSDLAPKASPQASSLKPLAGSQGNQDQVSKENPLQSSHNVTIQDEMSNRTESEHRKSLFEFPIPTESSHNSHLNQPPVQQVSYTLVEQALNEIKEFISILYGTCIRFYNTLLVHAELKDMSEDLIERVTTMLFHNRGLTELVVHLCKISTQEEEEKFKERLREGIDYDIKPATLNVDKYFTLDSSSTIFDFYLKQIKTQLAPVEEEQIHEEEKQPNTAQPSVMGNRRSSLLRQRDNNEQESKEQILESGDIGGSNIKHIKEDDMTNLSNENDDDVQSNDPNVSLTPSRQKNIPGQMSNQLLPPDQYKPNSRGNQSFIQSHQSQNTSVQNDYDQEEDDQQNDFFSCDPAGSAKQAQTQSANETHVSEFNDLDKSLNSTIKIQTKPKEQLEVSHFSQPQVKTMLLGQMENLKDQEDEPDTANSQHQLENLEEESPAKIRDKQEEQLQKKKNEFLQELKNRCAQLPYAKAIAHIAEIQDSSTIRSPFEMIESIAKISKLIEECIQEFWSGITTVNPDKLVIDGDNILCLYLYIILRARIPNMFAFMKMMDVFSTSYVRSISRFGYCLCTLEIALERITNNSMEDLLQIQEEPESIRSNSYAKHLEKSLKLARQRTNSLQVEEIETLLNPRGNSNSKPHSLAASRRSTVQATNQIQNFPIQSASNPNGRISIREFNQRIDTQLDEWTSHHQNKHKYNQLIEKSRSEFSKKPSRAAHRSQEFIGGSLSQRTKKAFHDADHAQNRHSNSVFQRQLSKVLVGASNDSLRFDSHQSGTFGPTSFASGRTKTLAPVSRSVDIPFFDQQIENLSREQSQRQYYSKI